MCGSWIYHRKNIAGISCGRTRKHIVTVMQSTLRRSAEWLETIHDGGAAEAVGFLLSWGVTAVRRCVGDKKNPWKVAHWQVSRTSYTRAAPAWETLPFMAGRSSPDDETHVAARWVSVCHHRQHMSFISWTGTRHCTILSSPASTACYRIIIHRNSDACIRIDLT